MNFLLKYRQIILGISVFLSLAVSVQASEVDSLENLLSQMKEANFEKGKLMLRLAYEYTLSNDDTAKSGALFREVISIAKRNRLENLELEAYTRAGYLYYEIGEVYAAYVYYKKAEKIALKNNDKEDLCGIYLNLSSIHGYYGDFDNVAYYTDKIIEIASEWYDPETFETKDSTSDDLEQINKKYDIKSLMFMAQYLAGYERYKSDVITQEALDFNLDMFQKTRRLDIGYSQNFYFAFQCGHLYIKLDRPQEALYYLHLIREDYEKSFSPYEIEDANKLIIASSAYCLLAEAYAMLNQWDSTEYYLGKVPDNAHKSVSVQESYFWTRSMLEAHKGKHINALETFKLFHNLRDSLNKSLKTDEIARLKMWHEFERKENEKQIMLLEKQKDKMLIMMLAGFVLMLAVLFTLLIVWYYKSSK